MLVKSVVPGPIDVTEGMDRLPPTPEIQAGFNSAVPMVRTGLAGSMLRQAFLSAKAAGYLSGAVIAVKGVGRWCATPQFHQLIVEPRKDLQPLFIDPRLRPELRCAAERGLADSRSCIKTAYFRPVFGARPSLPGIKLD